jgi:hypothetical protein
MRTLRNRFCSHVVEAVQSDNDAPPARFYTLIAPEWLYTTAQLAILDPQALIKKLRALLIRVGLDERDGWCVVVLHGEYNRAKRRFHLHFHALVVGDKIDAFEALRQLPQFKGGKGRPVHRPIVVQEVGNLPRQVCYLLQSFWPGRTGFEEPGVDHGRGPRRRIPEPAHAAWLLWMARRSLTDIVWLHGISLRDGHLTRPARKDDG